MTMLSDFLKEHGITAAELVNRSQAVEKDGIPTRALRVKRAAARAAKKPYSEANLEKPKSLSRGLTLGTVEAGLAGKPLPRLARKKILRAVNNVLTTKKVDATETRKLFGDVKVRKPKKKK